MGMANRVMENRFCDPYLQNRVRKAESREGEWQKKKFYLTQVARGLWPFPMVKGKAKTFPCIISHVEGPQDNLLETLGMGA